MDPHPLLVEIGKTLSERPITFAELVERFGRPEVAEHEERSLAEDRDAVLRDPIAVPPREQLRAMPPASVGAWYAGYMDHFGLTPSFFPGWSAADQARSLVERTAARLNEIHDFLHVLGEYETSDEDEFGIQSFIAAQVPASWSLFFQRAFASSEIVHPRYKHLRDVMSATVRATEFRRGLDARRVVTVVFEEQLETPLAQLRRELSLAPREGLPSSEVLVHTCAIQNDRRYFLQRPE